MSHRILVAALLTAAPCAGQQTSAHPGSAVRAELTFRTSDKSLQAAFDWARAQALFYVSAGGDRVGDWYEAALPGREAFCMRDVSHQAMGAHALGLHPQNRNMLLRFAENISASKDWCSYWEINRHNQPAPVDYRNDNDFWYNLPANFDVLDACFRVYLWSGDRALLENPAFVNSYARTMADYIERWDLSIDRILRRQRIMNLRGDDPQRRFSRARGIPSYEEQRQEFLCGADLVAAQVAAWRSYARIQMLASQEAAARRYGEIAQRTQAFLNHDWWDRESGAYHSFALPGGKFAPGGLGLSVLYFGAADAAHAPAAVDRLIAHLGQGKTGIEAQSHVPETLYRYGRAEAAYAQILDLTRPDKERRKYPEVSYAVVGAIMNGTMGIEPDPTRVQRDARWTPELDGLLLTLPRLTSRTLWAEVTDFPFRANRVAVRHEGVRATVLRNAAGPPLRWRACLPVSGARLRVDATRNVRRLQATGFAGAMSCADVTVGAGEMIRVAAGP